MFKNLEVICQNLFRCLVSAWIGLGTAAFQRHNSLKCGLSHLRDHTTINTTPQPHATCGDQMAHVQYRYIS